MKAWDIIVSANANLLRNKGRSFLTILAIFIGSFTIIMTTGINNGVNSYIDKQLNSAGGKGYLEIVKGTKGLGGGNGVSVSNSVDEYSPNSSATASVITSRDIDKIKTVTGIATAQVYRMLDVSYITAQTTSKKYNISAGTLPSSTISIDLASGHMVDLNSSIPQIVIAEKYVTPLGFKSDQDAIGRRVTLAISNQVTGTISTVDATVSGVAEPTIIGLGRSWLNNAAGDKIYDGMTAGLPQQYRDQAYLATAQLKSSYYSDAKVQQVKNSLKGKGYTAMTVDDEVGLIKTFFDAITTVLTAFGVIALIAASIGIINTLFMSVQERTREIGLMKAMGLGRLKIFVMFSWEAAMLGFWGALLGVGIAYGARAVINSVADATFLKNLPGFTLVDFNIITLLVIVLIVVVIAFLAGTLPAHRASKKNPIEALRYE